MYNPFSILNAELLADRLRTGKRFFVRQSYPRGLEPGIKKAFLLRAYEAEEEEKALAHMKAITEDPYAFLYDANNAEELERLETAATQPAGYRVFYAGHKGISWKPPLAYQQKMRKYLQVHHADWKSKPTGHKVEIGLYEEFGALFLKFSFGKEDDHLPFDQIENY